MSAYEMESEELAPQNGGEMRARLSIWATLAQLFHNKQLHDRDYDRLASELLAAGQTAESARYMLIHEVAPVFFGKVTVMGGDSHRWPASLVESMMRDFLDKKPARQTRLRTQSLTLSRNILHNSWGHVELRLRLAGTLDDH